MMGPLFLYIFFLLHFLFSFFLKIEIDSPKDFDISVHESAERPVPSSTAGRHPGHGSHAELLPHERVGQPPPALPLLHDQRPRENRQGPGELSFLSTFQHTCKHTHTHTHTYLKVCLCVCVVHALEVIRKMLTNVLVCVFC